MCRKASFKVCLYKFPQYMKQNYVKLMQDLKIESFFNTLTLKGAHKYKEEDDFLMTKNEISFLQLLFLNSPQIVPCCNLD